MLADGRNSVTHDATDNTASKFTEPACVKVKPNPAVPPSTPSHYFSRGSESFTRSLPLAATITKLNVVSQSSDLPVRDALKILKPAGDNEVLSETGTDEGTNQGQEREKHEGGIPQPSSAAERRSSIVTLRPDDKSISIRNPRDETLGWLRWFSNSVDIDQDIVTNDPKSSVTRDIGTRSEIQGQQRALKPDSISDPTQVGLANQSLISLWKNSAMSLRKQESTIATEASATEPDVSREPHNFIEILERDNPTPESAILEPTHLRYLPKFIMSNTYGWAFWSGEKLKQENLRLVGDSRKTCPSISPSQPNPESVAVENMLVTSKGRKGPQPLGAPDKKMSGDNSNKNLETRIESLALPVEPHYRIREQSNPSSKQCFANLLLPSMKRTYRMMDRPSLKQRLNRLLQLGHLPDITKHVSLHEPGIIKKAMAIVGSPETILMD